MCVNKLTRSTQNKRLPIQSRDRERTPPFVRDSGEKIGNGMRFSCCWYSTVPDTQYVMLRSELCIKPEDVGVANDLPNYM